MPTVNRNTPALRGREQDWAVARRVQDMVLGAKEVRYGNAFLVGGSTPFHEVGGDYFDILPLGEGCFRVVVADIMGKGIGAAMLMMMVRAAVRALSLTITRPGELVRAVNGLLYEDLHPLASFLSMTCVYVVLERGRAVCANGGHPYPILFRAGATQGEKIKVRGCMLGVLSDREFEETIVDLGYGDTLLLYSDGFIEAMTPEGGLVGFTGLEKIMLSLLGQPPSQIIPGAVSALIASTADDGIRDDLTLALVGAGGREPAPPQDDMVVLADSRRVADWLDQEGQPNAPAVFAGQAAAVRVPGHPGTQGFSAEGAPRTLTLQGLRGVSRGSDADTLVAAADGRLGVFKVGEKVLVEVLPVHHQGADTLEPGSAIDYPGDVIIDGDLDKGQTITAGGNVHVLGKVVGGRIAAGGSVVAAGGIIRTEIQAGLVASDFARVAAALTHVAERLGQMAETMQALMERPAFRQQDLQGGLAPLLRVLAQQKFVGFPGLVDAARAALSERTVRLYPAFNEVLPSLLRAWQDGQFTASTDLASLETLRRQLSTAAQTAALLSTFAGHVRIMHADHSNITAQGSVSVTGSGVYRCRVVAQGAIVIAGKVLGDHLQSDTGVVAAAVGRGGGAATLVAIPVGGYVDLGEATTGTEVRIGSRVRSVDRPQPVRWRVPKEEGNRSGGT